LMSYELRTTTCRVPLHRQCAAVLFTALTIAAAYS
jgi:hypothetical protein